MANKLEFVIVDTQHKDPYPYCFADTMAEAVECLEQARNSRKKDIERYAFLLAEHPDNERYKLYLEEAGNTNFVIMSYGEYLKQKREYYLTRPIEEISEERFDDAFNCLPPLHIRHLEGKNWYFSMSEFYDAQFTGQYAYIDGKFYYALVDITDRSTYIYNRLEAEAQ